jgi:hypothetical protein
MSRLQGNGLQIGHLRVIQAGGDQQDGIGTHHARFVDLPGVDHEILAQHRQLARGARLFEVVDIALEKLPVGQHRQASRADHAVAVGIALRDVGRNEILRAGRRGKGWLS